jgi:hypothetical protein
MELKGQIHEILQTQNVSDKFKKRDCIIFIDDKFPQYISIQFTQDKCAILDSFKVGDFVEIGINIQGRRWTSPQNEVKYFNTIVGWRINKVGTTAPVNESEFDKPKEIVWNPNTGNDISDLPF